MSSQTTKRALRYMEKTEFLVTSIRTQKPTVNAEAGTVGPRLLGDAAGQLPEAPDWDRLQDYNLALLEASIEEVRRTDQIHRHNLLQSAQLSSDRNSQVVAMRGGYRDMRSSFKGTYGKKSLPLVGLDGTPARASLAIREQFQEVVERMRDPQLTTGLGTPRAGQSPIPLETLSEVKEGEILQLGETLAQIKQMRKRRDESKVARDEAQKRHRRIYANVARVQEGIYRLAGLDELANRIRVTEPAPRRKGEAADGGGQDQPQAEQVQPKEVQSS